ncbi:hydroxyisourate hydrolase [Marinivivus vitaminiproducens]|uniref:hydroxyisourate hydrolase n=1 Tax=Marinivivus vitaminiproducens TaxID=3035935 RepID=UPI00279FE303|nr:hydroxyisourate hydrolase [Geminicoccaceae bacterium SCSIO 64248]
MGRLTTHVLDLSTGRPAEAVAIELWRMDAEPVMLARVLTNGDGRTDVPLVEGDAFTAGRYQLVFHAGDYFRSRDAAGIEPPFLDRIPIAFGVADASPHLHVPLLLSPYGYSTYRGS